MKSSSTATTTIPSTTVKISKASSTIPTPPSETQTAGMNSEEFRKRGKEMVDYIADYLDTIENRRVTPAIEPGYLKHLVPLEAPQKPEDWDDIMKDVEDKIMPGVRPTFLH